MSLLEKFHLLTSLRQSGRPGTEISALFCPKSQNQEKIHLKKYRVTGKRFSIKPSLLTVENMFSCDFENKFSSFDNFAENGTPGLKFRPISTESKRTKKNAEISERVSKSLQSCRKMKIYFQHQT